MQFTSDLLPADILGYSIYDQQQSSFHFHHGPVFTQVLLADKINRTTPKTQSALLEVMAERQVTVEGQSRPLPDPFFVIATQNPVTQSGSFPLPESQLDRFLMRIQIGYPTPQAARNLLTGQTLDSHTQKLQTLLNPARLAEIAELCVVIKASGPLLDYVQRLIEYSRTESAFAYGISPRSALALLNSAKAWAYVEGKGWING